MRMLSVILLGLWLGSCGDRQTSSSQLESAARMNSACKAGQRTGPECEAVSRELENTQHREAHAAFQNMVDQN